MPENDLAVMLYGNGADLGNFKLFADDLAAQLVRDRKFSRTDIVIKQTLDRATFFAALTAIPPNQKIKELHIFSHSIGGGLYIGYHERAAGDSRAAAVARFPHPFTGTEARISYDLVLDAEIGGILTDHLLRQPLANARSMLRAKFSTGAILKIWGCNSGVSGWVYSDTDSSGHLVTDQNAPAEYYYWRALNTLNVPKPSIAQAFADFFGVTTYGAGSGSHIEVFYRQRWITSTEYKRLTGRFAGEPEILRLHPDRGDYNRFSPSM
jgi:hypothetical protein